MTLEFLLVTEMSLERTGEVELTSACPCPSRSFFLRAANKSTEITEASTMSSRVESAVKTRG